MRVLVVMPSIPLQGMERATLKIMQQLKQADANVRFVLEDTYGKRVEQAVQAAGFELAKTRFTPALRLTLNPFKAFKMLSGWWTFVRELREIERAYAPTHLHFTSLDFFLMALPVVWNTRACVVFRLPNPPDTALRGLRQAISNWVWRRLVLPQCDRTVCNSHYTESIVHRLARRAGRVVVIRNMVPRRAGSVATDAPVLDHTRFNVVYLGRIHPDKGVDILLRTAVDLVQRTSDIDFYLAGEKDWQNPFARHWEEKLNSMKLGARIRMLGELEDVPRLLQQAALHVCPSISPNDSFPNVILEAKAQAVPSVVFPVAGLPEAVEHLRTGFVCRDATQMHLAEGLMFFYQDRARGRSLGAAARASLDRFDEELIGREWLRLYRECQAQ